MLEACEGKFGILGGCSDSIGVERIASNAALRAFVDAICPKQGVIRLRLCCCYLVLHPRD